VNSRALRLSLDAVFLLLALVFLVQDWSHHDTAGAILWGALTVFWVAMIPVDLRRTDGRVV
jgi:hypothetical protein